MKTMNENDHVQMICLERQKMESYLAVKPVYRAKVSHFRIYKSAKMTCYRSIDLMLMSATLLEI